jgi:hypothetical protein
VISILRQYKFLLQTFIYFFRAPQRVLHVLADIFFADHLGEFRLVNQLRRLLARHRELACVC